MLIRALIVMLVALNLGVAAWWAWRPEPQVEARAEPPSGIARLRMLDERPGASKPRATEAPQAAAP
ncbi:MAG: SPOR domain-containing protein, partial [Lysobacter sp.]|nr:SPOR domain-containing protein [Lysobacter sp.]